MEKAMSWTSGLARRPAAVPRLCNGDHLSVEEFERRYAAMPEVKKAELIEGVVYMPSPVTMDFHGSPHSALVAWLKVYSGYTPGTQSGDNVTLKLQVGENQPQPDGALRILPKYGGQSDSEEGYVVGGIEFVGEVAASSVSYDLHEKKRAYEKNGVQEYVVWRVEDGEIDWFVLRAGKFHPLSKTPDGLFKSKVFPGLWLDEKAMLEEDIPRILEVLQQGIASPEHQRFVEKLRRKKK
jgi:Uma2 family endonuclease